MSENTKFEIAHCKKCGQEKIRKDAGYFGNGKDRRWVDENGKQWNGRCCPDCVRDKVKNYQKQKRNKNIQ